MQLFFSNNSKTAQVWKKIAWKLSHNCKLNYTSSSPGMETAETTDIFSL